MYVSDCISMNERGHLTIGSYDTVELAKIRHARICV